MNDFLAHRVIQEAVKCGVTEFCICPGARNSPFVFALDNHPHLKTYFWFEERSAAFFALGRSRASNRPVAVITTSGTAAAELLPATMEAYYTGIPLLLITADRPRRFRGTGAPQTAEQVGLFGCYASLTQDLAKDELCDLSGWSRRHPAHLNICFEEPSKSGMPFILDGSLKPYQHVGLGKIDPAPVDAFFKRVRHPLVVVSTLRKEAREPVCAFLHFLNAPALLEAPSGLREDPRLAHLRVENPEQILDTAAKCGYQIDGILRIGGVPTNRLWRDLEERQGKIEVCSINDTPFSGLSWGTLIQGEVASFFSRYRAPESRGLVEAQAWLERDRCFHQTLLKLFAEEPHAEASMVHALSHLIPPQATVYLGNSLPIREWDLAASFNSKALNLYASRGLNGIDGQISTFLGYCSPTQDNWAIIGDLTALYDMAGPWILSQMDICATLVIINNSGGQIFNRMFPSPAFLNSHELSFAPLADLWGLSYEKWTTVPKQNSLTNNRLIEIVPDPDATTRFWKKLAEEKIEEARTPVSINAHQ